MDLKAELAALKPTRADKVFDVVESLGFDVSDWISTATNPKKIKANPKYCYNWSFLVPGRLVIFNLWHSALKIETDAIIYRDNFRRNAQFHRLNRGKPQWVTRGERLDQDAAIAARENLPVRVLVVDGYLGDSEDPSSESSKVERRQLDPKEWHVRSYDLATGDFLLARGQELSNVVDQFDMAALVVPEKKSVTGSVYNRDPRVRRAVLRRSNGRCEYCGEPGFKMSNGGIYLETHHVLPLCDGGADHVSNVAALCPNDHKRAHFALEQDNIQRALRLKFSRGSDR